MVDRKLHYIMQLLNKTQCLLILIHEKLVRMWYRCLKYHGILDFGILRISR